MVKLPRAWVLCSALLLSALPALGADSPTIYRCESARGVVSYSDSPCPAGTRTVRTVDREPTLEVAEPSDKATPSNASAGKISPAKRAPIDPWVEDQRLNEQIAQQRRACAELERRIAFHRGDLNAAVPGRAASIELELRRAQDEFQLHCAKR
jgi:hypothetical protein